MADNGEHGKKTGIEGDHGNAPEEGVARSRSNDPLAELARLIDEDPFADFDRARDQAIPQDGQANIEWEVEPFDAPASTGEQDPQPFLQDQIEPYASDPDWDDPHDGLPEDYLARFSGLEGAGLPEQPGIEPHPTHDGGFSASAPAQPVTADDPGHDAYDPVAALEAHLLGQNTSEDGSASLLTEGRSESFHDAHEIHRPEPEWSEPPFEPVYPGDGAPPRDLDREEDLFAREPAEFVEASHAGPANAGPEPDHKSDFDLWDDAAQVSPAYDDEEVSARRSKRGLAVLGSLVGLVVLGGAVALGYRGLGGDPGGDPPVIRADSSPTKVMAEDEAEADSESGSKLVYDRIGGNEPQQEERLVSREEPVFDVVGRDGRFADGDPGGDIELRGGTDQSTAGAGGNQPRRVRTVVVRPDGTVVGPTEESTEVALSEPQQVPSAPQAPQANQRDQDAGEAIEESFSGSGDADRNTDESEVVTDQAESDAVVASESAEPVAVATATESEPSQPDSGQPLRIIPNGTAGQPEQLQPTPDNDAAEIARAPATSETEQSVEEPTEPDVGATTPFPSGSYVVQIASTRSEDDARNMASRATQEHSSLLEGYQTGIQEADLGDRGIFYRVGVGPMSARSDATALCERMQSAGLDCFVRQN